MKLNFTDLAIDRVPPFGDGSSFDQRHYDGQAQRMNVLKRYERCGGTMNKVFQKYPRQVELSKQIFGDV
jgi:hypothetical protein